jgi:hypothetical protein
VEGEQVTEHDVLVGFRLPLFTLAKELGNVGGVSRDGVEIRRPISAWTPGSTAGLEALVLRERRRPRMPNQMACTCTSCGASSRSRSAILSWVRGGSPLSW